MSGPMTAGDRGLQAERTALAWSRTSLALVANGVLVVVRHVPDGSLAVGAILAVAALVLALVTAAVGRRRSRALLYGPADPPPPPRAVMVGLGLAITILCGATTASLLR